VVNGQDYITINVGSPSYFEFFTPKLVDCIWNDSYPVGYITRVAKDGKATAVAHTDTGITNPDLPTALADEFELCRMWSYPHGPQIQAVNPYMFWPDRAGPEVCLQVNHKGYPCPSDKNNGVLSPVDHGYDTPPTVYAAPLTLGAGSSPYSIHGSAPAGVDWYRQSAYNKENGMCYMVTADQMLYVYRPAPYTVEDPPGVLTETVPPNVTVFASFNLKDVFPPYVMSPVGRLEDAPPNNFAVVPDPEFYPDYAWSWRSDCKKLATVGNIGAYNTYTVLMEFSVDVVIDPEDPDSFTVTATLDRHEESGVGTGKFFLGAEYAYDSAVRTYTNPEPLLVMYTSVFFNLTGLSNSYRTHLFVEDDVGVVFDYVAHDNSGLDGYAWLLTHVLACDLRSLSFVLHTRYSDISAYPGTWNEAVFVYSFGKLQHAHGFFGVDTEVARALFINRATDGELYIPPDLVNLFTIKSYYRPYYLTGPVFTAARTWFQVHPKGHFSINVGPIIAGERYASQSASGPVADVAMEQYYIDLIGFKQKSGSYVHYSHRDKCNEAWGLSNIASEYNLTVTQFMYGDEQVWSYSHPQATDAYTTYKKQDRPSDHRVRNASPFSTLAYVYKNTGDPSLTQFETDFMYMQDASWTFGMPYIRGDCIFIGKY